ncbi:Regulator of chromosome condensation (RCC1) repeat protein [Candidatus Venteria ishoeyi]|uniref:Regulator of chromosome condensation (RCC1) repeat protein n=1 Tax=Candidatus Venteria ishoeyi TaxID=1899563 RepID=A0A1H6F8Q5_9GAMM|nr:Regulator of chromosome condensation (RCC1) repeat protein [Candidatus Venteria ishoeyi]
MQIGQDNNWVDISCGGGHSLAIKSNGTLWTWGANNTGQLGIDSISSSTYPLQVGNDTSWVAISAGYEFSLGLKSDWTIWSWGFNGNGQLGTGASSQENVPIQIGQGTDWTKIEAGSAYSFAIKSDSSLWAWGFNAVGQLGDGSLQQQNSPIDVDFGNDWKCIAAAEGFNYAGGVYGHHTLGIKSNGEVICSTGSNYIGQLGDGTINDHEKFYCTTGSILEVEPISNFSFEKSVDIFPNPNSGIFQVALENENYNMKIEVFNNLGKLVYQNKQIGNRELQLSWLSSGVYFIKVISNEQTYTSKFIVE